MIERDRVKELCRRRGMHFYQLADAMDVNRGQLDRYLKNPALVPMRVVVEMASVLHVPTVAIDPDLTPEWDPCGLLEVGKVQMFHEEMRRAECCLTITNGVESYLQSDGMIRWTTVEWLRIPNWDAHWREAVPYVEQQRDARAAGRFRHRIVSPAGLFDGFACRRAEWVDELGENLCPYRGRTVLGMVEDWAIFKQEVNEHLPVWARHWHKICVVDETMVMIRSNPNELVFSYRGPTVRGLLRELDRIIKKHLPHFPSTAELKRSALNEWHDQTLRHIQSMIKGQLPAEGCQAVRKWSG